MRIPLGVAVTVRLWRDLAFPDPVGSGRGGRAVFILEFGRLVFDFRWFISGLFSLCQFFVICLHDLLLNHIAALGVNGMGDIGKYLYPAV